ncbi:hypothetical protein HY484_02720 [Candidatus Woesearchaeota archaeon]|nr:hypothetical protein [Candidatus Woesearchaeota archaeon]
MNINLVMDTGIEHLIESSKNPEKNGGHLDIAEFMFTKAIKSKLKYHENAYLHGLRGIAWAGIGEYEKAVADLTTAIECPLFKNHFLFRAIRSDAFLNMREYETCIADATNSIKSYTEDWRLEQKGIVHRNRGFALNVLKRFDEAIEDFNISLELAPKDRTRVHSYRGDSYRLTGNTECAKADYETALTVFNGKTEKQAADYLGAIRAERGLKKLGLLKEGRIEQEAIEKGILTEKQVHKIIEL